MTPITNVVFVQAKAGAEDRLEERLSALVDLTRDEAGCLNYDLHRSTDRPGFWFIYENWRNPGDLVAHMSMPYMTELMAELPNLVEGEVSLQPFSMISTPDTRQR